jgi:trans-aconitate methyltransferase
MQRILEPELMQDKQQVNAFHSARRPVSTDKFIECFDKFLTLTAGTLIDLGCGTGTYLNSLKLKYPELDIIGYDGSQTMIDMARELNHCDITFICKEIKDIVLEKCDAVTCFFTMHHLHNPNVLINLLQTLQFPTQVLIVDIVRPGTIEDAIRIRDTLGNGQSKLYKQDLFNSLCAALDEDEMDSLISTTTLNKYVLEHEQYGKIVFITGKI